MGKHGTDRRTGQPDTIRMLDAYRYGHETSVIKVKVGHSPKDHGMLSRRMHISRSVPSLLKAVAVAVVINAI